MASSDCIECTPESQASNHLAIHLYKLLIADGGNVFISPHSIATALAMLYCGSQDETSKEMRSVLGYDIADIRDDQVKFLFQKLINGLQSKQDSYTLTCANSVLFRNNFSIRDEYKTLLEGCFKASLQEVDFQNESTKTVHLVNEWVKENSNGMIPHALDSLNPDTRILLLNVVYFKGFWKKQFDEKDTTPHRFYNNGREGDYKQVAMMHLEKTFPFLEKSTFKAIKLPYRGDDIAMLILLPKARNGLEELESLFDLTIIEDQSWWPIKAKVSLPKFRLEYSKSLTDPLKRLGLNRAFASGAQFGGIGDSGDILVSDIVHKSVFEVNETGSEAGALSEGIPIWDLEYDPEFVVDHPFMFLIYNQRNNLILFMGSVKEL